MVSTRNMFFTSGQKTVVFHQNWDLKSGQVLLTIDFNVYGKIRGLFKGNMLVDKLLEELSKVKVSKTLLA